MAVQVAGRATRDALFLSHYSVSQLPAAMIVSSAASLVAVLAFSAAMSRRGPGRVVPALSALAALLFVAEWALAVVAPAWAAAAVYLHLAFFGATLVSGFWSVVNERFDPYTARRVVGRIGLGAALGGVAGGVAASVLARVLPLAAQLLVCAAFTGIGFAAVGRLRAGMREGAAAAAEPAVSGMGVLRRVGYLRHLAAIVALGAVTEALLDYVLGAAAAATYARGTPLLSFFALYQTAVAVGGLALQTLLVRPLLRGWGLAPAIATQPAVVLAAGALAFLDPRLWAVALTRGAEAAVHNSLYRSGYELLYTPVPPREKRPAKAIVDVGFDKLGALLGSGLTLGLVAAVPTESTRLALALALAASVVVLAITRHVHAGYVEALEQSLRSGAVHLEAMEAEDSTTHLTLLRTTTGLDREALRREIDRHAHGAPAPARPRDPVVEAVAALRSGEPDEIRRAMRAHPQPPPELVAALVPLLARNDVFLEVLRTLRRVAERSTGQLVDALVDPDGDAAVRRRLPRVLKAAPSARAAEGLLVAVGDARLDVRMAAAQGLARMCEQVPALAPARDVVFRLASRELALPAAVSPGDGSGSTPVGSVADRRVDHVFTLLALALDREALGAALNALRAGDARLRGTALEWLDNVLPEDLRAALWPHLKAAPPAARAPRPENEVREELLQSSQMLRMPPPRAPEA